MTPTGQSHPSSGSRTGASLGRRVRCAWLVALLVATAASAAHAGDDDTEREMLARIANELQHLQVLVTQAAQSAPPAARVKFRYDWLERDLQMLRDGVMQHVDAPRQPRPVPPLRGDYRQ